TVFSRIRRERFGAGPLLGLRSLLLIIFTPHIDRLTPCANQSSELQRTRMDRSGWQPRTMSCRYIETKSLQVISIWLTFASTALRTVCPAERESTEADPSLPILKGEFGFRCHAACRSLIRLTWLTVRHRLLLTSNLCRPMALQSVPQA